MTDIDILRLIYGIVMVFILPGYVFVKALFPGKKDLDKEYNELYVITLGMGLSIVVTILTGFFLNALGTRPGTDKGYIASPYIDIALISFTLIMFWVAWYRGAFPIMGKLHPALLRVPKAEKDRFGTRKRRIDKQVNELQDLGFKREKLKKEIRDAQRKMKTHSMEMKNFYKTKKMEKKEELKKVLERITKLEEEVSGDLAEDKL
jgi:hypothetical protein